MWLAFNNAIKEGDGDRILTCYKFILHIFKAGRCFNYCKETILLLTQYHCLFSDRQKAQLKWSRCVNTKGHKGGNIPCDLHLEHLNCCLKGLIRGLHANVLPNAIRRASRSVVLVQKVCEIALDKTEVTKESGRHTRPAFNQECEAMVKVLDQQEVFMIRNARCPRTLKVLYSNLQQQILKHGLQKNLIHTNCDKLTTYNCLLHTCSFYSY